MTAPHDLNNAPVHAAGGDTVRVARHGAVWVVTIDRPAVRNAIDRVTSEALAAAMDQLDADPTLSVGILTGAGGYFCAGRAVLRRRLVQGSKGCQLGASVLPSSWRQARWPSSSPVLTGGILAVR